MKKIQILAIFILSFLSIATASAMVNTVYDSKEDFEKNEGQICKTATDGCNTFGIVDGKVKYSTRMYCGNHDVKWECIDEKINSDNMYYTTTVVKLSNDDINLLKELREEKVHKRFVVKVDNFLKKYKNILLKYDAKKVTEINNTLINKLDEKISKILLKYPQGNNLPENINRIYLELKLIKLELMKI